MGVKAVSEPKDTQLKQLTDEIRAIVKERMAKGIRITWQLLHRSCQKKMNRHCAGANPENKWPET
jgi:hypothetical protein